MATARAHGLPPWGLLHEATVVYLPVHERAHVHRCRLAVCTLDASAISCHKEHCSRSIQLVESVAYWRL
eukprot:7110221-Karenia_brevis.AAC.1